MGRKDWKYYLFCGLLIGVVFMAVTFEDREMARQEQMKKEAMLQITPAPVGDYIGAVPDTPASTQSVTEPIDPTREIYTFLQGPKSWEEGLTWSGKWGKTMYDGGSFGGFGCGLCCLANIYCSTTEYLASPVDMYQYAKKKTEYGGGGAIAWEYMDSTLHHLGYETKLGRKPKSYSKFQNMVAEGMCAIVLVSSYHSDIYWKDTPGHYVTIFLYDEAKDKVFLADSGDPNHNRHWVPLKTIYKALKTESDYQYLNVLSYEESKDSWKHKKAKGKWIKPQND